MSALQTIHMKYQTYFHWKIKQKIRMASAAMTGHLKGLNFAYEMEVLFS